MSSNNIHFASYGIVSIPQLSFLETDKKILLEVSFPVKYDKTIANIQNIPITRVSDF